LCKTVKKGTEEEEENCDPLEILRLELEYDYPVGRMSKE
jgi:hypothetical protein